MRPRYWNTQATVFEEPERFWLKVDKSGPLPKHDPALGNCWVWKGALVRSERGVYGQVRANGRCFRAHRVAWMLSNGTPLNLICHKCDNTLCVRPSHLYDGTARQNSLDAARRSGMRPPKYLHGATETHCRYGHERPAVGALCTVCVHEWYLRSYAKRKAKADELGLLVSHVLHWT